MKETRQSARMQPTRHDKLKTIGITVFDGFALPEIARIVESFQRANESSEYGQHNPDCFNVRLLSSLGGRIASSSAVLVLTESVETDRKPDGLHALFVAGGPGVSHALRDDVLLAWLRRTCPLTGYVFPVDEGHLLLDAAGFGCDAGATRRISSLLKKFVPNPFTDIVCRNEANHVSEKIRSSARWIEANGHRHVGLNEAARVAQMSERNFLRRFKAELGVTPSDYLLYVRLDMSCRMLAETTLPVGSVARRCGMGSGGRLAKLFRKHLGKTPTAYRANHRRPSA
ncbi:helix-turn-helix domain-containing protein [Paraburkholderia edwinii]|jgi:transcriptional regulator GlxA family with amidase domain|uniref:Helix-turn-helix domain-containing protein n=1 Tax=Paraburkholderia edwinii TaxID=2861782 RepID=A0ABX8UST1_9BURK|nr:helix-turn-helix domain-containing protein [Paraburkholderia edwinii]